MPNIEVEVTASTKHVVAVARVIAKHLSALADELEALDVPRGHAAIKPQDVPAGFRDGVSQC